MTEQAVEKEVGIGITITVRLIIIHNSTLFGSICMPNTIIEMEYIKKSGKMENRMLSERNQEANVCLALTKIATTPCTEGYHKLDINCKHNINSQFTM